MFFLRKSFEKQTEKQVDALKSLKRPNKTDKLRQIDSIFPKKKQLNHLIIDGPKEIIQLQNNVKLDDLEYTPKRGKCDNCSRYSLPIVFLRDMHEGNLSLEDAQKETQLATIQLANKLNDMVKIKYQLKKGFFK